MVMHEIFPMSAVRLKAREVPASLGANPMLAATSPGAAVPRGRARNTNMPEASGGGRRSVLTGPFKGDDDDGFVRCGTWALPREEGTPGPSEKRTSPEQRLGRRRRNQNRDVAQV
jgi:hypothetical protein